MSLRFLPEGRSRAACRTASQSGLEASPLRTGRRCREWLRFVFGTSVVPALDLVDRQSVTRLVSPSGRTVYQVVGSSGKLYTCYGSCHFCSCPAFAFSVLRKGDNLVCKHILAVYLSRAIGACQEQTISNQQMTALLLPEEK
ncbi:zinc finger SWIM domain-containing protein 7 isoform 1-T1 [Vipera latastei]